uniref:Uncharacterized protein n=1 Tax=Strongyloides venezuelensis TaxID=75913 RepID=A0A0K0FR72_STRVS
MAFNFVRKKYLENSKIMEKIKGNLEDQLRLQRYREVVENFKKKVESFGLYLMDEVARSRAAPPDYNFLHSKYVKIEENKEGGGINIDEEEEEKKLRKKKERKLKRREKKVRRRERGVDPEKEESIHG